MRVLLALDGSSPSDNARQLVASLPLPAGTIIDVVGVAEPVTELLAPLVPSTPAIASVPDETLADLEAILDAAVVSLERPSVAVDRVMLVGRPATAIVEAATELQADLVVVGNRGRGQLTSMVLGSVSAEIVDHAPCPVLVARQPAVGNVLVAVDGSASARAAIAYLSANQILLGHPVEVLTVGPMNEVQSPTPLSIFASPSAESFEGERSEVVEHSEGIASGAAARLLDAGHSVRWSIARGHAAHEIVDAARCFGTGLIVMGSRGHTGLARILLGSVARNVLLHSTASILIVHEPTGLPAPLEESIAPAGAHR